ncbi:MAG: family 20 glycosylhydrolase [Muribaculaceae bacterium]|nr:family 20 glycosylhydrolase [Muribaculaceae bacterium]
MLKHSLLALGLIACMGPACSSVSENTVVWETLGNSVDADGNPVYTQRFTVTPGADGGFDRLAFCMFKRGMSPVDPQDTLIELLPGYFAVGSPRFAEARKGEPVVVDLVTRGSLRHISYAPDGMHLVADGKTIRTVNTRKPITATREMYSTPDADGMIYGDEAFAINDSLRTTLRPAAYCQIPTPKNVRLTGASVKAPKATAVHTIADDRHDYWRATVTADSIVVYTNSNHPGAILADVQRRVEESADAGGLVPTAEIEDWADYAYRALMIDVARNFTGKDDMKHIIGLMARYGLNTLHFHVGDDEGWRVEIPALPELTAVGARRGYTTTDDVDFLKGIYSGDGNPDATDTPANGYYTVDEYIELLRYADSLGVAVVPEFDSPGHSRAAIRAMEHRYRTTGDASLRLIQEGDTSRYTSAQDFHDNIMNPALEGPYKFWGIVFDGLADIYAKAGVPMPVVHIGGDEVPRHAWDGSEAANKLMAEKGLTHQRELHALFVERVAAEAAKRGIKIAGWQEIALGHSKAYDEAVRPVIAAVNCWTNAGNKGPAIAGNGYPLVLSNVDYLYFDQTPTSHPEEPGLTWGGIVDEFRPLHATVDVLCPAPAEVQARVYGVSGQLFAETVRSRAMVERYILPRLLGLAERAHNARTTISDAEYFGALTAEMPRWQAIGSDFYLRQPGIRLVDGKIEMNEAYGGFGEIRYTLDGSQPTAESTLYTGPFDPAGAKQVRARLFAAPAQSVTSILNL